MNDMASDLIYLSTEKQAFYMFFKMLFIGQTIFDVGKLFIGLNRTTV